MSHRGALPGMTVSVTVGVCVLLVKLSAVPMLRGAMPNAEERGVRIHCRRLEGRGYTIVAPNRSHDDEKGRYLETGGERGRALNKSCC